MTRYKPGFLLLATLFVWQNAVAQPEKWGLPPSPNGKLTAALLDAINESNADVHREFITAHFTPEFRDARPMHVHLGQFQQMHEDLAGAQVNGVDMMMGAMPMLMISMKTRAAEYMKLEVSIEQTDPPRIADLSVDVSQDGPPPAELMVEALIEAISKSDEASHRQFIETYFSPAFKDDLPMETHLELLQRMHKDLAGADVAEVNAMSRGASDETVTILMVSKAGNRFNVTFDVQLSSPPRLITLNMKPE